MIAGGVIGIGIDAASGANFYYDSPITVDLTNPTLAMTHPDSDQAAPAPVASASAPATSAAPGRPIRRPPSNSI